MNRRHSRGGYHNRLTAGTLALACLQACTQVHPSPTVPAPAPAAGPLAAERAAVVAQVNQARAAAGLAGLAGDGTLERVGNAHCEIQVEEGTVGHFSHSGVPPYLRYLLAGGHGFHRENAAMFSSSAAVPEAALGRILARSVASMLAELPPDDGHRRALLDPDVTHIGVGLAVRGGEVRMTNELATEATVAWSAPPVVAKPRSGVALAGALAREWRPTAAEVLWGPLPRPLSTAQANAIHAYGYPPPLATFAANQPWGRLGSDAGHGTAGSAAPFAVDRFGNFTFKWSTGTGEGIEIVVVLATRGAGNELVPVAAAAIVVTDAGTLPPDLAFWHTLAGPPPPAPGGAR